MVRRTPYTNEEFAVAARAIHGDRYDYRGVEYVSSKKPVTIHCSIHGPFEKTPTNHLRGQGCPLCSKIEIANKLRKSPSDFVAQAHQKHGARYDYSKVDYRQARAKVEIVCGEHGSFWQEPFVHLRGAGCPKCRDKANSQRITKPRDLFIADAREVHGGKFDYSNVTYISSWMPVTIICPEHGEFQQTPVNHLNSTHSCPQCTRQYKRKAPPNPNANSHLRTTLTEFLGRAREVHGDKYDYTLAVVDGSKSKVTIVCPEHGAFVQRAIDHLKGVGCQECAKRRISEKQRSTKREFVDRARSIHGSKFDYSLVEYVTARKKVLIICPIHGEFQQTPDTHLAAGCRLCADDELPGAYSLKIFQRNPDLAAAPAILYYVQLSSPEELFYKVGITRTKVKARFGGYSRGGYEVTVIREARMPLLEAFQLEQEILQLHGKKHPYRPARGNRKGLIFGGRTECFSSPLPEEWLTRFG